jgi:hypothetical protein
MLLIKLPLLIMRKNHVTQCGKQADGLFIESTDEFGECTCAECSRKLDELEAGSSVNRSSISVKKS